MAATHLLSLLTLFLSLYLVPTTASRLLLTTSIPFPSSASFSTHFSFSVSHNSSISLVLLSSKTLDPPQTLTIEFKSNSVSIANISCPNSIPTGDRKTLHAFVDYRAASSQLEVRFETLGKTKPYRPLIVFPINLFQSWGGNKVFAALGTTSSADSVRNHSFVNPIPKGLHSIPVDPRAYELAGKMNSKVTVLKRQEVLVDLENLLDGVVHMWHFRARAVPKGLHSIPVDPRVYERRYRSGPCYLTVISALMIAVGCSVFVVFMVMFFKVICTDWDEVLEMEYTLKPVKKGYEMIGVDVENNQFGGIKR